MILKVTEINPDTIQAVRIILFQDENGFLICIEGKNNPLFNDFQELREPLRFKNKGQALVRFETLVEELKYIHDT